jgi:hypothetical protein
MSQWSIKSIQTIRRDRKLEKCVSLSTRKIQINVKIMLQRSSGKLTGMDWATRLRFSALAARSRTVYLNISGAADPAQPFWCHELSLSLNYPGGADLSALLLVRTITQPSRWCRHLNPSGVANNLSTFLVVPTSQPYWCRGQSLSLHGGADSHSTFLVPRTLSNPCRPRRYIVTTMAEAFKLFVFNEIYAV